MIDWMLSKSGHDVPCSNGQVLASRYDPVREAKQFLESRQTLLDDVECVFLVGAGNPFIVQELLRNNEIAAIIVVDENPELIAELGRRFQNDLVSWVCPRVFYDDQDFRGYEKFFRLSFTVLVAPAAQFLDSDWVQNCVSFINGHSVAGFQFQLSIRFPQAVQPVMHLVPEVDRNFGKQKALDLMRTGASAGDLTSILSEIVR